MRVMTARLGALATIAFLALALGGCGDDKKESTATTTTAAAGPRTINGCKIEPGTSCPGANLSGQNLQGVNLTGANLATTNFASSDLSNANLSGANLTGADFQKVKMINTNLSNANLTQANFSGGDLDNVNMRGATHCGTIRTDGSIDNLSCPQTPSSPSTTSHHSPSTSTTINISPPGCDQSVLLKLAQKEDPSATANASPVCADLNAAMAVKTSSGEKVGLFHVGADTDSWILVAFVTAGNLPPSVAAMCPGLPPAVAGVLGCGSG